MREPVDIHSASRGPRKRGLDLGRMRRYPFWPQGWRTGLLALLVVGALTSQCWGLPAKVTIRSVPHVLQKPDFCGEACVSMALKHFGRDITQNEVFERSGVSRALNRGCWTPELYRAILALDVATPSPWIELPAEREGLAATLRGSWHDLKAQLADGNLVIVCMLCDTRERTSEHFRLLVGYDDESHRVIYHDPAVREGKYLEMEARTFLSLWPLSSRSGEKFLVRFVIPRTAPVDPRAVQAKMDQLKRSLGPGFRLAVQGPFVVASDLSRDKFRLFLNRTIRWAFEKLKKDFFNRRPLNEIIAIYLFHDDESYKHHALKLFGERPSTPFGYYSPHHDSLVMNVSTGGGTLVHEMVHPMLAIDFPEAPAWLNEGLGSLFEQCTERGGHIVGLLNWRLPGLKKAIRGGSYVRLKDLLATSDRQFYDDPGGVHYAEARYLMYWLQEKGILRRYYRAFRDNCDKDPTGVRILRRLLGGKSLDRIEVEWLRFVQRLPS